MKNIMKAAAAVILGGATLATGMGSASAAVVCNGEGECWHVRHPYRYHPDYGVVVHPDSWRWRHSEHYVWREHPGRGYWHNGVWVTF